MSIRARVNQLSADFHAIADALHGAFENVCDPELVRDLANVPCPYIPVLHHRRPADYLEIADLGQVRQDFILNPIGKVSVLFLIA